MLGENDTRNSLIKAYRDARGLLYVPPSAHKAIRWSKKDSLLEAEIHNVSWHIVSSSDQKEYIPDEDTAKETKDSCDMPQTQKRDHESIMTPEKQKNMTGKVKSPPHKITRGLNSDVSQGPSFGSQVSTFSVVPSGFAWSNNSCAYDLVLTILFSIWASENQRSEELFSGINSDLAKILHEAFRNITNDDEFEKHRDIFRYALQNIDPRCHRFGEFTAVGSLLDHLLATEYETTRIHNRCSNNHLETVHSIQSGHNHPGMVVHNSIQQWINLPSLPTHRRCRECNDPYTRIAEYIDLPQVISFELRDKSTLLNSTLLVKQSSGTDLVYKLAGIVYFGDMHFVARIIRQDGQIWFHDGITTQRNLIYEGSIASGHIDLTLAHSKGAHTGIYCRIRDS